jgi:2-oxo-4-hydroxy-4-carboxy--5-ureidoimidazoline (OHCU) decarboxylase
VSADRPVPPPPAAPPPIEVLDTISPGTFAASMAPLFEGAPRFLGRLAMARPYGTAERLFDEARRIAHAMPHGEQVELIDAHPRLGAPPGAVSALSFHEQGYDHGDVGDLAAVFDHLNGAYEARFGFRYCVFVAGRSRAALLPGFEAALTADPAAEIVRALDAVIDIARDRHARLTAGTKEAAR